MLQAARPGPQEPPGTRGRTAIAEGMVEKIAGIAAQEVPGFAARRHFGGSTRHRSRSPPRLTPSCTPGGRLPKLAKRSGCRRAWYATCLTRTVCAEQAKGPVTPRCHRPLRGGCWQTRRGLVSARMATSYVRLVIASKIAGRGRPAVRCRLQWRRRAGLAVSPFARDSALCRFLAGCSGRSGPLRLDAGRPRTADRYPAGARTGERNRCSGQAAQNLPGCQFVELLGLFSQ